MQKKYLLLVILIIGIILVSTSCFKVQLRYPVYYNVINNTDENITIVFSLHNYEPFLNIFPEVLDTIVVISPHQRQSLFVKMYKSLDEPFIEPTDTLSFLDALRIYNYDSIPSNKNFIEKKYWDFTQLPDEKAEYVLNVDENTFKP